MAGLQQYYFFPTDFLDTIKDHPSLPLDTNDRKDEVNPAKTTLVLRDSIEKKVSDKYNKVKVSSDSLPRKVFPIQKRKKKVDF